MSRWKNSTTISSLTPTTAMAASGGVGSSVDDNKKLRIVEFLDWLASPRVCSISTASLEGFIYTVQ